MLNNGDKLIVTKTIANFLKEGDIVTVVDVNENGIISFAFGDNMHMGVMTSNECEEHFEKVVEKEELEIPAITEEYIAEIMENSEFETHTVFGKCKVVSCRLPNGFVITESSSCVHHENFDEELAEEICFDKIASKIWELEAYRLQQYLWEEEIDCCCENCDGRYCICEDECDEEFDECLDTDLDCDDCEDFDCPYNSNINR